MWGFTFLCKCLGEKKIANSIFLLWQFILTWLLLFLCDLNASLNTKKFFASDWVQAKHFHWKKAYYIHFWLSKIGSVPHWLWEYLRNMFLSGFLRINGFCDCTVSVRLLLANIHVIWQRCGNLKIITFPEVFWKTWVEGGSLNWCLHQKKAGYQQM